MGPAKTLLFSFRCKFTLSLSKGTLELHQVFSAFVRFAVTFLIVVYLVCFGLPVIFIFSIYLWQASQ